MSTVAGPRTTLQETSGPAPRRHRSPGQRVSRWLSRNAIRIYALLGFTYLFVPVAYTLAFSFNDSGKSNISWRGFTLDKWKNPCGAPDVCSALGNSLKIGALATVRRHGPGHDDRLRAGPAPVPGAHEHQPDDLPADGHA